MDGGELIGGVGIMWDGKLFIVKEVIGDVFVSFHFPNDCDDHRVFPIRRFLPDIPPCNLDALDNIWENFSTRKDDFGLRHNQRECKLRWLESMVDWACNASRP